MRWGIPLLAALALLALSESAQAQTTGLTITFNPSPAVAGQATTVSFNYPTNPPIRYLQETIPAGCVASGWSANPTNVFGRANSRFFGSGGTSITASLTCASEGSYTVSGTVFTLDGRNTRDLASGSVDLRVVPPPEPVILLSAKVAVENISAETKSAALVEVPVQFAMLRARQLAASDASNLVVCAENEVRCWDSSSTVSTKLTSDAFRVFVPQLEAGASITYDLIILRDGITQVPDSTTADGANADYSVQLSGWTAYQPVFQPPVVAGSAAFIGPEEPTGTFAGVQDLPTGLPGSAFLTERSRETGIPGRFLWVVLTFPIVMIAIALVQRVFDNILYSVIAGGVVLTMLCSPAVGIAVIWVVIFYAVLSACVVIIGRRISAGI